MAADGIKGVARMWGTSEEANQAQYVSVKRFRVLKKAANGNGEQENLFRNIPKHVYSDQRTFY